MKSRLILNIVLAVFIASIFFYLFNQQANNNASNTFLPLPDKKIDRITIPREGGDIQLVKKDNHWFMLTPHSIHAHDFRIKHLLQLLKTPVDKQYNIANLDLSAYALDPPKATLYFNDTEILFGKKNPVTNKRYLQINEQLFLLFEEIFPLINAQTTSFIDSSIIPKDRKITRLVLPDLSLTLTASGWNNNSDNIIEADAIVTLLESWQAAQAFGVHLYMPRKHLGEIEIRLDNDDTIKLEITDKSPWLILARPDQGIEYHLDVNLIQKLLTPTKSVDANNA